MAIKSQQGAGKRRIEGFDRAIRELNAFLLVLAIGLAVLDATCFLAFRVRDSLPAANRVSAGSAAVVPSPRGQTLASVQPTRPVSVNGW